MTSVLTDASLAGPCIFWYWNATPTRQQIEQQIDEIAAAGFQGIYVHPMPQSFRPAEFNGGMELEYLSPAFFDLVAHACCRIKQRGLIMWLYDEGGWPSGRAGGLVVREDPAYGIWLLEQRNGHAQPVQMTDQCTYPDLMNPAATDCFIRLTHERYKAAIGSEFGTTVRGIFTDEARLLGRVGTPQVPWSPRFPQEFEAEHKYALGPAVSHLFHPAAAESIQRKTQRDYLVTMGRLIADNYYARIEKWCAANDLLFEGHHSGEDDFARHGQYFGDYLRQARHYHVPGVDTIWRQIFPGRPGGNFVQLASSAAWRRGSRVALSESFGVYGPGLTIEQMKWVSSFQAVRGIAKIGVMAYYLGTAGARWLGICSEISGRTPTWSHIDLWTAFVRNVAGFICAGDPLLRVGVYYRTELTLAGEEESFTAAHERLCDQLGDQWVGWAFIGLDDLNDSTIDRGTLHAGKIEVGAVVVHIDGPMTPDEVCAFSRVARGGVRVIVVGGAGDRQGAPAGVDWVDSVDQLDLTALRTVDTDRSIRGVRLLELRDGNWRGYLVFNQNPEPVEFALLPRGGAKHLVERDLEWAAGSRPRRPERQATAGTMIHLGPGELRAYETSSATASTAPIGDPCGAALIAEGWRVRPIEAFTIDGDVARSRQEAEYRSCRLGDLSGTMPAFAGTVEYALDVDLDPPEPGDVFVLDLGTVYYAADVYVNGVLVGRRAWAPYWFEITDRVVAGSNRVQVRVTGTLAAAWLDAVGRMDRAWRNTYVERVEPWAAETRRLGIVGPVMLNRWRK